MIFLATASESFADIRQAGDRVEAWQDSSCQWFSRVSDVPCWREEKDSDVANRVKLSWAILGEKVNIP